METMHAAGRRRLPPVPRPAGDRPSAGQLTVERPETVNPVVDADVEPAAGAARTGTAIVVSAPPDGAANQTDDEPVGTSQSDTGQSDTGQSDTGQSDTGQSDTELIDTRQIAGDLIEAELAARSAATPAAADHRPATTPADDDTDRLDAVVPTVTGQGGDDHGTDDHGTDDHGTDDHGTDDHGTDDSAVEEAPVLDSAALDPAVLETLLLTAPGDEQDPAQQFVARLRSSATDFAGAAGADSAVVREAVPPARHRRARCRLVLRFADGTEIDVTLLGPAGRPGRPSRHGFDRQILRWLGAGLVRDDSWLTTDPDAPDGVAVDLTAWVSAG